MKKEKKLKKIYKDLKKEVKKMIFTEKDFKRFKTNENGYIVCPTGDYSRIKQFPAHSIFAEGCFFGEWSSFAEGCSFGERCSFAEGCSFGEGCKAISPYWAFVYAPPFETEGKIYPPASCREYWEERLKIKLEGCYGEIEEKIVPLLPKILERKDLTECERRILESWLPKKEVK